MLVIMKCCGCQPMILIRSFSNITEASKTRQKHYRNANYYVPIFSEKSKQSINRIVSLQMSGQYLGCTTILRDGNILADWKMITLPENMNKFHLDNVYNSVIEIMEDLPEADVYVIENYAKMPKNVNVAGANLFYVKLQTIAMLIALINSKKTSTQESMNRRVILMKARLHARLFRIIIGTEIVSSRDITELMLKGTFPEYVTPFVPSIDAVISYRSVKESIVKEIMSNSLLLAMTFVDLVLNSNPKSIEALNDTSNRKMKNTEK